MTAFSSVASIRKGCGRSTTPPPPARSISTSVVRSCVGADLPLGHGALGFAADDEAVRARLQVSDHRIADPPPDAARRAGGKPPVSVGPPVDLVS